ncbi:MAG: peptidylprolyl isomerase [Candidatus Micrarchaeaceae archaeon]
MKTSYLIGIIIIVVVIIITAIYLTFFSAPNVVVKGDNVSVFYTGYFTNGTVFNSNVGGSPFNFTAGSNQTIVGFDNAVLGMSLNQIKNVTIPPNEAYGEVNPNLVVVIPSNDFSNKTINVGSIITDSANGQPIQGVVLSTNSTSTVVNFNSPLAGKTLIFSIKVVNIRK